LDNGETWIDSTYGVDFILEYTGFCIFNVMTEEG